MPGMLQRHPTLSSTDFDETRSYLALKGLETRLAGSTDKDFSARINAVYGRGLYIAYMEYGADIEVDAPAERSDYGFSIPYAGSLVSTARDGVHACTRQSTVLASPGRPQTMFMAGGSRRLSLSVQQDVLRQRLAALTGEDIHGVIEFEPVLEIGSGVGHVLTSNIELIVAEQDRGIEVFADRLRECHFEEMVLSTLLLYHPHSHRILLERPMSAPASRDVKRTIDFIQANLDRPLALEDLIAVANVPGRTLNEHFRAFTGRAPMAYLKAARLHAVRRLLMSGETPTVTDAALQFGFHHLGRFASHYRLAFGEPPSDTLHRARHVIGRNEI